jgi:hypothetical protein
MAIAARVERNALTTAGIALIVKPLNRLSSAHIVLRVSLDANVKLSMGAVSPEELLDSAVCRVLSGKLIGAV